MIAKRRNLKARLKRLPAISPSRFFITTGPDSWRGALEAREVIEGSYQLLSAKQIGGPWVCRYFGKLFTAVELDERLKWLAGIGVRFVAVKSKARSACNASKASTAKAASKVSAASHASSQHAFYLQNEEGLD